VISGGEKKRGETRPGNSAPGLSFKKVGEKRKKKKETRYGTDTERTRGQIDEKLDWSNGENPMRDQGSRGGLGKKKCRNVGWLASTGKRGWRKAELEGNSWGLGIYKTKESTAPRLSYGSSGALLMGEAGGKPTHCLKVSGRVGSARKKRGWERSHKPDGRL